MKKMTFLVNPPRKRGGSKARTTARKRVAANPRRKRRPPPAGWSSWSAYMASIRPNAKRAAASSRGNIMSRKRSRRRSSGRHTRRNAPAASNPPRRRGRSSRRYRHNPPAGLKNIVPFAMQSVTGAGGVLAGKIIVRKARGLLGQKPGTIIGSVIEAAAGIVAGLAVQQVSPRYGALVAIGGVLSPMETLVQQLGIPGVSDSLADDGFLFGGDSGVELVSAADDGTVSEFVTDGRNTGTLSEFVQASAA